MGVNDDDDDDDDDDDNDPPSLGCMHMFLQLYVQPSVVRVN